MRYLDRPARLVCPASSIGDLSTNPIPYRETRGRGMGDQYPFWQEATPGVIFFPPETSTYRCEDDRVGTTEQRMEDGVYGDLGTHSDREREREREEIHATAEHWVSGEGNSSNVLPNPSGSPKRRTPDTRGWRKWVGSSIHAIPGVSQSALVRAQMLLMSTEQSTSTLRQEAEANSYSVHSARHCSWCLEF